MVREITLGNRSAFQCEICNFKYKEKALAQKCENWCKEHHSCSMEITKQAIK